MKAKRSNGKSKKSKRGGRRPGAGRPKRARALDALADPILAIVELGRMARKGAKSR